jgi:NTE family protein
MAEKSVVHSRQIAIACQGGGSHAAFGAGVLEKLLGRDDYGKDFVFSALTGTSGGAVCAGIAWAWLLSNGRAPLQARAKIAAQKLRAIWMKLACEEFGTGLASGAKLTEARPMGPFEVFDAMGNAALVSLMRLIPGFEADCRIASDMATERMLELLRRHLPEIVQPLDDPILRLGATNIVRGSSKPLEIEALEPREVAKAILASASIPPLYGPCRVHGEDYWDGLFSHNPPIDCLTNLKRIPDEIWVIQINPTGCRKAPATMAELVDRRNELMGNLSLQAELYHIDAMNQMLEDPRLPQAARDGLREYGYRPIGLRVVALEADLDFASKYERSRGHIEHLMDLGRDKATEFFEDASKWTCPGEGVHEAHKVSAGKACRAPKPSMLCPNAACPSIALCNTIPAVRSGISAGFDYAQKHLALSH